MTLIQLSQIKPSPHPIRKSWDEEKMEELAQSIKEQGLIVPIKVRPANEITKHYCRFLLNQPSFDDDANWKAAHFLEWEERDDGTAWYGDEQYEIVYGHRRVEAARRAGLSEIECIVEGVDDSDTLIQALIENVQREDMEPQDIYDAAKDLIELKSLKSFEDLAAIGILRLRVAKDIRRFGNLPDDIRSLVGKINDNSKPLTMYHISAAGAGVGRGEQAVHRNEILKKAIKEGLTAEQTEKVAESVAATQDPRRREALINTPYSSFIHDPEINRERAEKYGTADPFHNDRQPSAGAVFEMTMEVRMIIDYLRASRKDMTEEVRKMYQVGKFSPEAVPFILREARMMVEAWQKLIEELENEDD